MNLGIDILIIQDLINIVVGLRDHDGDLGDKRSMDLPQDGLYDRYLRRRLEKRVFEVYAES